MRKMLLLTGTLLLVLTGCSRSSARTVRLGPQRVHTYYIAADEVDWNYTPSGVDKMMGKEFMGYAKVMTEHGPHRIGTVYRKAVYREYTDASFSTLKPRPAGSEYLGILGPVLRAEVGDTIRVLFKNNASHPFSMHPHGVLYKKDSEGALYADGTSGGDKADDGVPPGQTHTYTWEVPERAGPGPRDPSSVVWLYHSHTNDLKDVESGLIGAIVVTRRGMSGPDGKTTDVDREFVNLFMIFDENASWYLDYNIRHFTGDPKGVNKAEIMPSNEEGASSVLLSTGFGASNLKATINGYMYANMPVMTMKKGERVRWYLVTVGQGFNFHTPHWHGNVVTQAGQHTDVVSLSPAQMETVDMVPDNPGLWLYHCHVADHMHAGMVAMYRVEP
jgi:FtsP/CotA-like multicopper oxidase with cupredoxin domain